MQFQTVCSPFLLSVLLSLGFSFSSFAVHADPLQLSEAQALAAQQDVGVTRLSHLQTAAIHQAVSANQLPDPSIRFGAMNLPTDTFDLDQEAMTQLQLGVRQQFPAGNIRKFRQQEQHERADAHGAHAVERQRSVRQTTAMAWLDRWLAERSLEILGVQKQSYQRLMGVTRAMLASGKSTQADLLAVQLQLEQQIDRMTRSRGAIEIARTALTRWIGEDANRSIPDHLPPDYGQTIAGMSSDEVLQRLRKHPRYRMAEAESRVQKARLQQSLEAYKPAWGLDLGYGIRDGHDPRGNRRSDLASAMVSLNVPLFPAQRQDAVHGARTAERLAAIDQQRDVLLQLQEASDSEMTRLATLDERLHGYAKKIIPRAIAHARAQLNAYRSASGTIHDALRAEISTQQARLAELELVVERRKALVRIDYLHGEPEMALASTEVGDE